MHGRSDKILFLDIDGVLNSDRFFLGRPFRPITDIERRLHASVDPIGVQHLCSIVQITGAQIVLSSSWRQFIEPQAVARVLAQMGCEATFIGRTPTPDEHDGRIFRRYRGRQMRMFESYPRGYEIQQWLDENGQLSSHKVILDDDPDMAHLRRRLVQTDRRVGLTAAEARRAVQLLMTP